MLKTFKIMGNGGEPELMLHFLNVLAPLSTSPFIHAHSVIHSKYIHSITKASSIVGDRRTVEAAAMEDILDLPGIHEFTHRG